MRFVCPAVLAILAAACGNGPPSPSDSSVDLEPLSGAGDLASPPDGNGNGTPQGCRGWCWELPTPTGNSIAGLSSAGARLWAVTHHAMLHWDGVTWSTFAAPGGITLADVAAVSDDDVWAVGVDEGAPPV